MILPAVSMIGCGGKTGPGTSTAQQQSTQTYFAPFVEGTSNGGTPVGGPQTYTISDPAGSGSAGAFKQTTYLLNANQEGAQVINAGEVTALQRGLLSLGVTANYSFSNDTGAWVTTDYSTPKTGGFAVELAGQAGGLVQLPGQPAAPVAATAQCPNFATPQTYQFVTIPNGASAGTNETAYGSVDIGTSGSTVNLTNIQQFTLSSTGGAGAQVQPAATPVTGACGTTSYGNTISIPYPVTITNPGGGQTTPPPAVLAIGPSGLLVEDNGLGSNGLTYQTSLSGGTGAIGLPRPSQPLDTGTVVGAQYLGFIFGAPTGGNFGAPTGWSSHVASFGFTSLPSNCSSVAAQTTTLIYGGDFTNDNPSASPNGFGNCDFAIDLGPEDSTNNGFYPNATVWMGAGYAANTSNKNNSFSAVGVAGQLNGKYALFVLGANTGQQWAIYLLQSN
ncbi:hypothetical protein [Paracidobacterium acidisoli]|uniref:Uncharacterized protein n=1 Tax=Paracidobacterium acidisoli TaxID=2303751 RepID=A0A372IR02_9BACT|nr:hypothetical protein [Paracidobacterium acidisoli]MBT9331581.1 hypothetical protein [Paracidobacterium acidisoli]